LQRGEIWWARLPAPARERPVLLLSRNDAYAKRLSVTIAPVTTTVRGIPVEVPVGSREGLPRPSVINVDDITTIALARLARRVGELTAEKMNEVEDAIRIALALPPFAR
jgi:mRNA interferase MazF